MKKVTKKLNIMNCSNCNHQNPIGIKFCVECGKPINKTSPKDEILKALKLLLDEGILTQEEYNLKEVKLCPHQEELKIIKTSKGDFEKLNNKKEEAFCLGCRKVDQMENLYFNSKYNLYYHYECLKKSFND